MEPLFSIRGLRYLDILAYPDLDIQQGQTTFLQGESGAGKSTLLKLLNATLNPSAGQVFYLGQDILTLDTLALRREAILVAQDAWLFPGSIRDNFTHYRAYRGEGPLDDRLLRDSLHTCALDLPLETDSKVLSGGERQRVFLAICLAFSPRALLMDEPTSALDEATAHTLFTRLTSCARERGISLVAVSHDKALASHFAQRVITITGRVSA
ncbi:MAG: ATP-binding cassette domain-containing protein [Clostridiales bacterium]|nr:ATP-binding cassette domain-containing protein [Clostridiales bacterium]